MGSLLSPGRSALGGVAVLMACACGVATSTAILSTAGGLPATTTLVHPFFIALGAGLVVYGLWRKAPRAAALAAAAFLVLAVAAALTPPSVMTASAIPWSGTQLAGAGLYLAFAAGLAVAFWRAFPSPSPGASALSMSGVALAMGCGCCMVTGAVAGVATTAGAAPAFIQPGTVLFWTGLTVAAAGLVTLAGWRPVIWVALGGGVIRFGPDVLRMAGDVMVAGANLRSFAAYLLTVAGAGLVLYAFAVAYRRAWSEAGETAAVPAGVRPAPGGAGG